MFFEKILLSRIMVEINSQGLLRDEKFGFRLGLSTTLQLARLVERVKRKFDEKRPTGAVFRDVAEAFDSVWIEGLLFKLTILEFLSYLANLITSYLHSRTFCGYLLGGHLFLSPHPGWSSSGGSILSCTLQFVCERHANAFLPHKTGLV